MGYIGYLSNNNQEIKDLILDILKNRPLEHYKIQKENILRGRKEISLYQFAKH